MTVRTVVLVLLSILAAIFLILNWQGIVAPVPVNFIFGEIEAPLGLILLIVLGVLWVVGIAWSLMSQASVLLEIRRAYKEANANKSLANHAELSRTEQMKKTLQEEMSGMQEKIIAEIKAIAAEASAAADKNDARIALLEKSVDTLSARFDRLAHEAGIDLSPETQTEHKRGFFGGLFGGAQPKAEKEKTIEFKGAAASASQPSAPAGSKALPLPQEKTSAATAAVDGGSKGEPAATPVQGAATETSQAKGLEEGAAAPEHKKSLLGKIFR